MLKRIWQELHSYMLRRKRWCFKYPCPNVTHNNSPATFFFGDEAPKRKRKRRDSRVSSFLLGDVWNRALFPVSDTAATFGWRWVPLPCMWAVVCQILMARIPKPKYCASQGPWPLTLCIRAPNNQPKTSGTRLTVCLIVFSSMFNSIFKYV